ncbi:MAG: universal stress protein [Deltaproteobacteria bacterium]|nr:MAG: universal stress protein [Deltaproteobacteria bacterium]
MPRETSPTALVCLDLEPGSRTLVRQAAALAERCKWSVALLHALPSGLRADDARKTRQGELEALWRDASDVRPPVAVLVAAGPAEDVILDAARRIDADCIVLGRRLRPHVERIYVGSTTSAVLSFARRPVLVLPLGSGEP